MPSSCTHERFSGRCRLSSGEGYEGLLNTLGGCMSTPLETRQELRPVSGEFVPSWFETLENRRLLSGTGDVLMQPALSLSPSATSSSVVGLTPAQIKKAYGFDQLSGDGSGQTIAIVDAYNDPNILNDLKKFSSQFSLANPNLSVV